MSAMSDDREPVDVSSDSASKETASDEAATHEVEPEPFEGDAPENHSGEPQGLHRSTSNRKIGGVAGGIGERFDVNANIVRVGFVVLSFLWGLGVAIYLAMWALVPLSGTSKSPTLEEPKPETRRFSVRSVVLVLAALFVGLIFISIAAHHFALGRGLSIVWLVFLVALAIVSLRRPVRRFSFMRLVMGIFIAFLSLVILAVGAVLGFVALSGAPLSGGVGQSTYQPTSFAEVHHTYRMAIGRMTIDLRNVSFANHAIAITSSVGIGTLTIDVPPGVVVSVTAISGGNSVNYPIQGKGQFFTASSDAHAGRIDLNLKVGIGSINLIRANANQCCLPYQ